MSSHYQWSILFFFVVPIYSWLCDPSILDSRMVVPNISVLEMRSTPTFKSVRTLWTHHQIMSLKLLCHSHWSQFQLLYFILFYFSVFVVFELYHEHLQKKKGNAKIGGKNEIRPEHTGRTPESENPKRPFQLIKIQKTKT